ncbi:TetR/AcrR family transcriptional regulator [Kordiimonas marina]|uniref:TetR/AcrR family transcriptional regulator n=1 Tax=Kordiimonas marina TaxID=2872312 RepID=UPI001FF63645|nr:TetR/AcrR family transcriptional regulator [Kordiimonas marina]MCJ9428244.1 TetR/AcrR family transcriptional regulator [Kordiimonas marina]
MARPARLTKTGLAEKLSPVFERYGYDGASLSMLAAATGLSKASLYHHFPRGKEDMALYALAHAGARLQKLILAPLAGKDDPRDRLEASLAGTGRYYGGDIPHCLMNSLLLGEGRVLFADRIATAVTAWRQGLMAALSDSGVLGAEADSWAREMIERIQGALVLCRVSGTREPLETCLDALISELPLS